jgi:hypothetical protein
MKKFVEPSPLSDPATAARKLIEIASGVEAVQDGRIHIEKVNGPFFYEILGTPAQYRAGLTYAIERGWDRDAQERHLHPAYPGGRGPVRLNRLCRDCQWGFALCVLHHRLRS